MAASGTRSRRKPRKIPSLLPTEMSFFLGSQDALSSTVLPDRQPVTRQPRNHLAAAPQPTDRPAIPLAAAIAQTQDSVDPSREAKDSRATAREATSRLLLGTDPPRLESGAGREYSPRGAKLTALVALVDGGRSPASDQKKLSESGETHLERSYWCVGR